MSSTLMSRTLSVRPKTYGDFDREAFEKSQRESLHKAITHIECALKEKHARIIVIGTHKERGAQTYWSLVLKLQLQEHMIVAWKFCHLTHKILRDGHPNVLIDSQKYQGYILDLSKLWGHLRDGYGRIISCYCLLLNRKLYFHRKNPIPGNMHMEDDQLNKLCNNDINTYFELSVDMLDYMDDILQLQTNVFNSLDMTRANSMTSSGQCRLAPLILSIQDSCHLYDYLVKILFRLHSSLPQDTLSGHRERFNKQFMILKKFYTSAQTLQYFRNLIKVPILPEKPPNFLLASDFQSHVKPMFVIPDVDVEQDLVESIESDKNLVDFHVDAKAPVPLIHEARVQSVSNAFLPPDENLEREIMMKQIQAENEEIKRDMARMKIEDKAVMESMHIRIHDLEMENSELKQIAENTELDNNMLKSILKDNEKKEAATAQFDAMQTIAKTNEEKFVKMKEVYAKLRSEHVELLRNQGELNKQLNNEKKLKEEQESKNQELEKVHLVQSGLSLDNLQNELDAAKEEIGTLKRLLNNQKIDNENIQKELDLVSACRGEVEDSKKKMDLLLVEKSEQIDKLNIELNDLKDKQSSLECKLQACNKNLSEFEIHSNEFETEKLRLLDEANKANQLIVEASQTAEHERSERRLTDEKLESERKQYLDDVINKCKIQINKSLKQIEDANFSAIRSTAEYLLTLIHECISSTSELNNLDSTCQLNCHRSSSKLFDFASKTCSAIVFTFATANSAASIESGHELTSLSKELGSESLTMLDNLKNGIADTSKVDATLSKLDELSTDLIPKFEDVQVEKLADLLDDELIVTSRAIEAAANKLNQMLASSRQNHTGIQLEVNEKILDSCNNLMMRIKVLIEKSKILQKEIVAQGRGTSTIKDFYKKNHRWTEGLISAAKAVGFGAHVLVEAADKMVMGGCKFEELVVCAQEIAASTAQLVVASKVKANKDSCNLTHLSEASKAVSEATGMLVAEAKSASERIEENELLDFSKITLHQAKRKEMDSQVRVLELESDLDKERRKLSELRRMHYQLAGEAEGWTTDQ